MVLKKIANAWREFNATLTQVPSQQIDEAGVVEKWSVKDLGA